jgi:hypothetical protein
MAVIFPLTSLGAEVLPGENPVQFRNSLHRINHRASGPGPISIPNLTSSISDGLEKSTLSFGDLLVSESISPANFTQDNSDIAALRGGRTVAAWEDDRQGPSAVFIQIFDNDGNLLGSNAALISGNDTHLAIPKICADTAGYFYAVWREETGGFLQAARFDSLAIPTTSVFFISDTLSGGYAGEFDAACLPDGRLVVVWEDYSPDNNIVFQVFTSSGGPSTVATMVNSDGLPVKHWSPAVAVTNNNDCAFAWEDYRNGSPDIFFRRFNSLGIPYAAEISLIDAGAPDSGRYLPSLAFSPLDDFVAAWVDLRDGQNIYMQKVTASGSLDGSNALLSTETSGYPNWEVDLGINLSGHFLAVWALYGIDRAILLQRFTSGVQFEGSPLAVSGTDSFLRFGPAISANSSGNSAIIWTDLSSGSHDVFGAFYASDGGEVKSAFAINDDTTGSPSDQPDVVRFDPFEWTVVFTDKRYDAGDIMMQQIYVGGSLSGVNRRINGDMTGGAQSQPAVAANFERILVSWTDEREGAVSGQNIFCRFSHPQYVITDEMVVNDDASGSAAHYESDCAVSDNGISLVVWTDTRTGNAKTYGQLIDEDFQKLGTNFLIGPSAPAESGESPKVSDDANGDFIVTYLNRLNSGGPSVEAIQVTAGGSVTELFQFPADVGGYQIDAFDAGVNYNDEVVLVWHGSAGDQKELLLTTLDYSGNIISTSSAITDNVDSKPGMPDISVDNLGYVLVTWIDHRTGSPSPFRQLFEPTFTPLQSNLPVYSAAGNFMQQPATAGFQGRGIFIWADARDNGLNIYASQEIYEPTDVDNNGNTLPVAFELSQNYPNPFNPSTAIRFSMNKTGQVRLEIFNVLGQKVRTLIDNLYPAGSHSVIWDAADDDGRKVSSGVYLYRLENGEESFTRRMTFIK